MGERREYLVTIEYRPRLVFNDEEVPYFQFEINILSG
jgi:hypothetical protein